MFLGFVMPQPLPKRYLNGVRPMGCEKSDVAHPPTDFAQFFFQPPYINPENAGNETFRACKDVFPRETGDFPVFWTFFGPPGRGFGPQNRVFCRKPDLVGAKSRAKIDELLAPAYDSDAQSEGLCVDPTGHTNLIRFRKIRAKSSFDPPTTPQNTPKWAVLGRFSGKIAHKSRKTI